MMLKSMCLTGRGLAVIGSCWLIVFFTGCSGEDNISADKLDHLTERVEVCVQRLEKLSPAGEDFSSDDTQLQQVNATLQRLVGNLSPIQPHDAAVKTVVGLKERIDALQDEGITEDAIPLLRKEYVSVLSGMPPLAQESMLHELTAIEWSLDAFSFDIESTDSETTLVGSLLALQSLLETRPINAPQWLANNLAVKLTTGKNVWLTGALATTGTTQSLITDIEKGLAGLDLSPPERNQLLVALLKLKAQEIDSLEDSRLKQFLAEDTYNSAIALRYSLAREPEASPADVSPLEDIITKCESAIAEAVRIRQKAEERKLRQYQGWVLGQLDAFRRDSFEVALESIQNTFTSFENPQRAYDWRLANEYSAFRSAIGEIAGVNLGSPRSLPPAYQTAIYEQVAGVVGWKHDKDLARIVTREAMVNYLLPVDDRYLDPVVGKLFSKVYNEALSHLEGTDDHLYVAKKTVDVEKVTPADM